MDGAWRLKIELTGREGSIQEAIKRIAERAAVGDWDSHEFNVSRGGGGGDPIGFSQIVELHRPNEVPLTQAEIRQIRKLIKR